MRSDIAETCRNCMHGHEPGIECGHPISTHGSICTCKGPSYGPAAAVPHPDDDLAFCASVLRKITARLTLPPDDIRTLYEIAKSMEIAIAALRSASPQHPETCNDRCASWAHAADCERGKAGLSIVLWAASPQHDAPDFDAWIKAGGIPTEREDAIRERGAAWHEVVEFTRAAWDAALRSKADSSNCKPGDPNPYHCDDAHPRGTVCSLCSKADSSDALDFGAIEKRSAEATMVRNVFGTLSERIQRDSAADVPALVAALRSLGAKERPPTPLIDYSTAALAAELVRRRDVLRERIPGFGAHGAAK